MSCFQYQGPFIARASFSHHGWVLGRAWICHAPCQSGKPGQVAAHGTRCPVSPARHVNRNCLAATSRAPASPSVTSPLILSGTTRLRHPPFQQVSAVPSTAPAGSTRTRRRKTSLIAAAMEHDPYCLIRRGRGGRWRDGELPNISQVMEEGMVSLRML